MLQVAEAELDVLDIPAEVEPKQADVDYTAV
jgi:hypothetical protein